MPTYTLHRLQVANNAPRPAIVVQAASEAEALKLASSVTNGGGFQLWLGSRLIVQFPVSSTLAQQRI